ncbi:unnamed protein product [Heligmosomoides polygyrus]|uniref:Reverse transcriptase domain-containing protein n=1 Tax=Heligmosomoides polygyrus TaxID=6339 RepID=A0A183GHC3_HELPZ|nr:unnamed protein product [Heligmosomoides polygyrus]
MLQWSWRAGLIGQATGPRDRPAYEGLCHITWCISAYVVRDGATESTGADAHSQSRVSLKSIGGPLMRGRHRGATQLIWKSRKASRIRVATLNVGTLTGRPCELVEALVRRRVDFCAVQETRWSCRKSRDTVSPRTTSGFGIIVFERFRDSIVNVERFDNRLMKIVVAAKERLYHFFSAYAPQTGCSDQAMEEFWSLLDEKTADVLSKDVIIVADDLNGHRILEYAESHNLTIVNTVFRKRDSHLISFYSGNTRTQIDFVLVKDRDRSLVTDAKVVPYETVAPQHRPLICTLKIAPPRLKQVERCGAPRIKWWRMKEKEAAVISRVRLPTVTTVDETWEKATDAIRHAARSELGITKPGRRKVDKQAWLWTDDVKAKVREKKTLYHVFLGEKTADNWRKYQEAKKAAKKAVAVAKAAHHGDVKRRSKVRVREARLRWYGHVLRGKEDSVRKIGLKFEVAGKRPRGRPKQRWSDTLHLDLKVAGVHPDLALDREMWHHDTRIADPATKRDRR